MCLPLEINFYNKFYFYGEKIFLIDEIYIHEKILYLTKGPKFSPNNKKKNGPVCNLVTCLVRNYASINYIFLVSIPNCDPFKALDSRFPKFQNHIWFSLRNLMAWIWFRFWLKFDGKRRLIFIFIFYFFYFFVLC